MSSYFDEQQVQERIRSRFTRRFALAAHLIALTAFTILAILDASSQAQNQGSLWIIPIIITIIVTIPVVIWFIYEELLNRTMDREMRKMLDLQKTKRDAAFTLSDDGEITPIASTERDAYLMDTGEFVPEDDAYYPEGRRKRR